MISPPSLFYRLLFLYPFLHSSSTLPPFLLPLLLLSLSQLFFLPFTEICFMIFQQFPSSRASAKGVESVASIDEEGTWDFSEPGAVSRLMSILKGQVDVLDKHLE